MLPLSLFESQFLATDDKQRDQALRKMVANVDVVVIFLTRY
jgi:hypothetical protein